MTQALPSRSMAMLLGLLGAAALGAATLAAARLERSAAQGCRPGPGPEATAGAQAAEDDLAGRVAFV